MVGKVTDHEFDECPCECCGECVFVVHPDKKPPDMYCRRDKSSHARVKEVDAKPDPPVQP